MEADDDIRNLDAGVVDIVLHFDIAAAFAQHAYEGIAKNGVAEVSNVSGFVRVDVGVFDYDFFGAWIGGGRWGVFQQPHGVAGTIETHVDVAVARNFE